MDRAVHDFVGSFGDSLMLKNGADATSHTEHPFASRHDPPNAYSADPAISGAVKFFSQSGAYVQPASAQAMIGDFAAAIATFLPRETGPAEYFRLHVSSCIATSSGSCFFVAASHSHVPSVEPPSTTITSAAGGSCLNRLGTTRPISSASFKTVAITLTRRMGEV